jgi:sodium/potassium-transporting ATPase subunit alpha
LSHRFGSREVLSREIWFFTKIISALALGLFCLSIIIWGAWLRVAFPGYLTASSAIINSIGCLTAFVPQVRLLMPASVGRCP